ncbi:hypothetical protein [Paracoccus sp. IB05]|jgi:hypothetical protein|uniref:hypothetical protein n=1 Tax=Paracoccus sp. IB05 TaxID=2779367 RepID=UPI0018E750E9|nr:hypothetical protein [Paracoccus sp. IB05]MBJ2153183.1 hypothetical protein [Paracoccus sp. IB05]
MKVIRSRGGQKAVKGQINLAEGRHIDGSAVIGGLAQWARKVAGQTNHPEPPLEASASSSIT